jgi:hypothetical protein
MQDQKLTEINLQPGIFKELSPKAAEGYWNDADKIRFRFGKPELMGGWSRTSTPANSATVLGQPRLLEVVRDRGTSRAAVIGTHVGVFSSDLANYYNITAVVTVIATTSVLNTTAGSRSVIVSVSSHNLTNETIVGIVSSDVTVGDNIILNPTAAVTVEYQISVVDDNSFEIVTDTTAAATSAETGGTTRVILQYPAGRATVSIGGGWGTNVWSGNYGWGESTGGSVLLNIRQWSADDWGSDLLMVPSGGPVFIWSLESGLASRMVLITAAPSVNEVVRVATESRHAIVYGTHDIAGTYDPLLVRWCSQENYDDWTPTLTNTAGDFPLNSQGSKIVGVTKMRDQMLIHTDADIILQSYIGSNDVFGFSRAGENCGLIARNAAVEYSGTVYWMGNNNQFFKYDGRLQTLPCSVLRYVFDGLSLTNKDKIYAGTNSEFDEVIWLYPSDDTTDQEPDRYVIYNASENHWTIGTIRRTTWHDRTSYPEILATGVAGEALFYQEFGHAADTSTLDSYIESAYFDLDDGDEIMFCNKFVPDFTNHMGGTMEQTLQFFLKSRKYPGGPTITKGPYNINATTEKVSTRLRGREFALRIESQTVGANESWRMGDLRLGIQSDGKR